MDKPQKKQENESGKGAEVLTPEKPQVKPGKPEEGGDENDLTQGMDTADFSPHDPREIRDLIPPHLKAQQAIDTKKAEMKKKEEEKETEGEKEPKKK